MNRSNLLKVNTFFGALSVFCIPLKLSWTYAFLIPFILIFIYRQLVLQEVRSDLTTLRIFKGFAALIFLGYAASLFGLDPLKSFDKLSGFLFFSVAILAYSDLLKYTRVEWMLGILCLGHLFSAIFAILRSSPAIGLPDHLVGAVTQSGQLSFSILMAIGLLTVSTAENSAAVNNDSKFASPLNTKSSLILGILNLIICLYVGLYSTRSYESLLLITVPIITILTVVFWVFKCRTSEIDIQSLKLLVLYSVLPILIANLIVNLKRGPWFGITVGASFFLLYHTKKRYVVVPLVLAALTLLIPQVTDRLLQSYDHFSTSGGRATLWQIGMELSTRFPLGIGFGNSDIVRAYSPSIPPQLKHFHNDFINLLVEFGFLGLGIFILWIYSIIKTGLEFFKISNSRMALAVACGVIAWQCAGLVEYNIADSEINILLFFCLAILSSQSAERLKIFQGNSLS